MAEKKLFVHLNMNKQELQNAKAHNLTTVQIVALAATLVAGDKGLFVYDTTLNKLFAWSGTAFENVTPAPPQVGQYRGGVAHTAAEPASLVSGDWVVFTSAGVVTNFGGTQTVQIGDWAIYNGTTWDILQGNVDVATETTVGLVQLATQAETIAGTEASKVVTPVNLASTLGARYYTTVLSITANTPTTVTHNLGSFVSALFFDAANKPVELQWEIDDDNAIIVESNVAFTCHIYISKIEL